MSISSISNAPAIVAICAGVASILLVAAATWWQVRAARRDEELLRAMAPLLDDLWRPLRHLADLRSVWPDLNDAQRADIEASTPYQERHHEKQAEALIDKLSASARRLQAMKNWRLRAALLEFLDNWRNEEPDRAKVLLALVKARLTSS